MSKIVFWAFTFILSISTSFSGEGNSKNYLRLDYGQGSFKTEKLEVYNAEPVGKTYGASFGTRFEFVELGFFYKNMSFTGDIIIDSSSNKIIHEGSDYGLEMSIFLNERFSLKVGYAVNTYNQKLNTSVSASSQTAINSIYGLETGHNSTNVFYGGSVDLFANPRYDIYLSVIQFPSSATGSSTTAQIGIRIYMKSVLETFFSHN